MTSADGTNAMGPSGDENGDGLDPDLGLLLRYFHDELTEQENEALEARMDSDDDLWNKVGPVAGMISAILPPDPEAMIEAFQPKREPGVIMPVASTPVAATSIAVIPVVPKPIPVTPIAIASRGEDRVRAETSNVGYRGREPGNGRYWAFGVLTAAAAAVVSFLIAGLPVTFRATSSLSQHLSQTDKSAAVKAMQDAFILDQKKGWSSEEGVGKLIQDTTGPGETMHVAFQYGTRVTIRPRSRFAYHEPENASERGLDASNPATVDGEVVLELRESWRVMTRTAILTLTPGEYAIRCLPFSNETQLYVGSGKATIGRRFNVDEDVIHASSGDAVMIPMTGKTRVSGDSTGFPLFGGDPPDTAAPVRAVGPKH